MSAKDKDKVGAAPETDPVITNPAEPASISPADAPPDSPHGGLGKGKSEAIANTVAGEDGSEGILDHATAEGVDPDPMKPDPANAPSLSHPPRGSKPADKDDDDDKKSKKK